MEKYELESQIRELVRDEENKQPSRYSTVEVVRIEIGTDSIPAIIRILDKVKLIYPDATDWIFEPMTGIEESDFESHLVGIRPMTDSELVDQAIKAEENEKRMLRLLKQKYPNE